MTANQIKETLKYLITYSFVNKFYKSVRVTFILYKKKSSMEVPN